MGGGGAARWTHHLSLSISCPAQFPSPAHYFQQVLATVCFRDQVTCTRSEEHHSGGFTVFSWATGGTDLTSHTDSPLRAPLPGVWERSEGSLVLSQLSDSRPHQAQGPQGSSLPTSVPATCPGFQAPGHRGPFSEGGLLHRGVEGLNHKLLTPRETEQLPRAGVRGAWTRSPGPVTSQRAHLQPTGAPGPPSRDPTAHAPALPEAFASLCRAGEQGQAVRQAQRRGQLPPTLCAPRGD